MSSRVGGSDRGECAAAQDQDWKPGMTLDEPVAVAKPPLVVVEALRLADRIEKGYPEVWLREESQDALVQLARFVREELKLDA